MSFLQASHSFTFQQDNAASRTACVTIAFLNANNVKSPVKSQDMNPIEHLWDSLDRRQKTSKSAS